jgi:hypothetical protein
MGAYVQGNTYASGSSSVTSAAVTLSSNVTAGDLILVALGSSSNLTEANYPTDNQGNSYTQLLYQQPAALGGYAMSAYYTQAKSTGSLTVTWSLAAAENYVRMLVAEYSGYGGYDSGAYNYLSYASGVSAPSITFTTSTANDLLWAWCIDNNGVSSYSAPLAVRLTAGAESTGDNAGATNTAGSQTVTCNTASGGGGLMAFGFKATGLTVGAVNVAATARQPGMSIGVPRPNVTATAYQPTVTTGVSANPTAGQAAVTATAYSPTGTSAEGAVAGLGAVTAAAYQPTVLTSEIAPPGVAAVGATAYNPVVATAEGTTPGVGAISVAGYNPAAGLEAEAGVSPVDVGVPTLLDAVYAEGSPALSIQVAAYQPTISTTTTEVGIVDLSASTSMVVSTADVESATVSMTAVSSLTTSAEVTEIASVVLEADALVVFAGNLPQLITGEVDMTSETVLTPIVGEQEVAVFQAAAVASLLVLSVPQMVGETAFTARTALYVEGAIEAPLDVALQAGASMSVSATVDHVSEPSLEEQITALAGQDPILLGATGYMDPVFTTRLVGDTE